jgi:hypothetical protein
VDELLRELTPEEDAEDDISPAINPFLTEVRRCCCLSLIYDSLWRPLYVDNVKDRHAALIHRAEGAHTAICEEKVEPPAKIRRFKSRT